METTQFLYCVCTRVGSYCTVQSPQACCGREVVQSCGDCTYLSRYIKPHHQAGAATSVHAMMNRLLIFQSAVLILAITVFHPVKCSMVTTTTEVYNSTECILKEYETAVHYTGCEPTTIKAKACVAKECVDSLPSNNFHWIMCNPIKWAMTPHTIQFKCNGRAKKIRFFSPNPTACGETLVRSVP